MEWSIISQCALGQHMTVEIRLEVKDIDLFYLKRALENLGNKKILVDGTKRLRWEHGSYNKDTGILVVLGNEEMVNEIRQSYLSLFCYT
jgi:hypothetical protein